MKESLAKNFARRPLGWLGCAVNWNLLFWQPVVFRRESQAALWLVMPAARYFPEKESTQWPRPPSLAPLGQFTLSSPGDTPGPPPFNLDDLSNVRRGQGVRYALLAPLPLVFHRAEIPALTGLAPGFCGPFGKLPGPRSQAHCWFSPPAVCDARVSGSGARSWSMRKASPRRTGRMTHPGGKGNS